MDSQEWDSFRLWRQQIERRLNQLGSATKGNQAFQADRIADVLEQIDELRRELRIVSERLDKAKQAFCSLRQEVRNGDSHGEGA